jgi:hypothetical protein
VAAFGAALLAQAPQRRPDFVAAVDLVQTDVIARNARGQFIADLKPREFETRRPEVNVVYRMAYVYR